MQSFWIHWHLLQCFSDKVTCCWVFSRGKSFNVDVFLLHRALMTSCRPAWFFVAGPSFVLAVETLRRKIERSNLVAPARMGSAFPSRIKYHNAPGTSIGIRCNQFGRNPKAVACKSSLQGINAGDTGGNQTPLRGSMVRLINKHSIRARFPTRLDTLEEQTRKSLSKSRIILTSDTDVHWSFSRI